MKIRWLLVWMGLCGAWAMQDGNIEISGTVFAPPGKTVEGSHITFCPVVNNRIDCNSPEVKELRIAASQKSASAPYKFSLKAGKWVIYADKDVDGNSKFLSNGDYSGCHGAQDNTCLIVEATKNKVDIQMRVVSK
jgi:hypothetical protein